LKFFKQFCKQSLAPFIVFWNILLSSFYHLLIKRYNLYKVLAWPTTFFHLSLFCATFFQLCTFILLTCLGRPKTICPAFLRWAFLTSNFPVWGSWPHDKPPTWRTRICLGLTPLERVAFTTAKDSRLAPSYPWGRSP
jgi:hypothetical protein